MTNAGYEWSIAQYYSVLNKRGYDKGSWIIYQLRGKLPSHPNMCHCPAQFSRSSNADCTPEAQYNLQPSHIIISLPAFHNIVQYLICDPWNLISAHLVNSPSQCHSCFLPSAQCDPIFPNFSQVSSRECLKILWSRYSVCMWGRGEGYAQRVGAKRERIKTMCRG